MYDIYPKSFHFFQERKHGRKKAVDLMRAKVDLLWELHHIERRMLTPKGIFASKVYGYELMLAELFSEGILEELSETALGILSIAIVYEPRKRITKPRLSRQAKDLEAITTRVLRDISRREHKMRVYPASKACEFHLAPAMEGWLKGESFDKILHSTDVDEGEVVRYFRMAIQILREILDTPVSDQAKAKIYNLLRLINRDVIDSEKQLRS